MPRIFAFQLTRNGRWIVLFVTVFWWPRQPDQPPIIYRRMALLYRLGGGLLALTPISPFRPRRWRGALLSDSSTVVLDVLEAGFRPVSASADSAEVRHVTSVQIEQASEITLNLLYDPGFSLSDRAIQEQFLS
jgi:hypothetical protein